MARLTLGALDGIWIPLTADWAEALFQEALFQIVPLQDALLQIVLLRGALLQIVPRWRHRPTGSRFKYVHVRSTAASMRPMLPVGR